MGFVYWQGPPDQTDLSPGATSVRYGKGKAVFIALPIFYALQSTGFTCIQDALLDLLSYLVPEAPFHVEGPPTLEANLMFKPGALLLNLLYYYPNRPFTDRLDIEQSLALNNVRVRVRTRKRPSAVFLEPDNTKLDYDYRDGYTNLTIPTLTDWQIVELSLPGEQ